MVAKLNFCRKNSELKANHKPENISFGPNRSANRPPKIVVIKLPQKLAANSIDCMEEVHSRVPCMVRILKQSVIKACWFQWSRTANYVLEFSVPDPVILFDGLVWNWFLAKVTSSHKVFHIYSHRLFHAQKSINKAYLGFLIMYFFYMCFFWIRVNVSLIRNIIVGHLAPSCTNLIECIFQIFFWAVFLIFYRRNKNILWDGHTFWLAREKLPFFWKFFWNG